MSFILRIFFSGLIVFVPSENKKEVTVLLLDVPHAHHATGAATIPEHKPVLLARAAGCDGNCPRVDSDVASFLYPHAPSSSAAVDSLGHAVGRGAVWQLAGSELGFGIPSTGVTLRQAASADGKAIPENVVERGDFDWVANLKDIDPTLGQIDPAVFSENPPPGLIVARLTLSSGELSTHEVIQVDGKVMPIEFRPMSGKAKKPYVRAAAGWVEAKVTVPGKSLRIVETSFAGKEKREMLLTPESGNIDVAVLNISRPVRPTRTAPPQPGMHFRRFWDLAEKRPAAAARPVPQVPRGNVAGRDWEALHRTEDVRTSPLLSAIFRDGRSPYDQVLCPVGQWYPNP
jgi:hypothetical protein